MSPAPKFAVIIPTRERADVLSSTIQTIIDQDYDNLSIIVSDNFSQDDTAEVVRSFSDPRLRYINPGRRLSMSHHYEFALSHVEDGWVTIIGDDDALVPGALRKVAGLVADTGVSAVRSTLCKYRWPSPSSAGRLNIPMSRGTELRDSATWLEKVLHGEGEYFDLPMLYTGGFAEKSVMDRIKARIGAYYHSCVPDVYSGTAIASVTDRYLFSHEPLAIAGISRHSIGTHHFSRLQSSEAVSPVQKFLSEGNIPFHPDIPVCDDGITPRLTHVTFLESYLQSAPLRSPLPANFYEEQLSIIAASRVAPDADADRWMEDFARLHNLDLAAACRAGKRLRIRRKLKTMLTRFRTKVKTAKLREPRYKLSNVHAASIAAAQYLFASQNRG